jgi:hypothetical protein
MKAGDKILEQFYNLPDIEPSPDWNEKMMQRLAKTKPVRPNYQGNIIVVIAIVVLMTFNALSITVNWVSYNHKQNAMTLKNIAGEFFINSESSKY